MIVFYQERILGTIKFYRLIFLHYSNISEKKVTIQIRNMIHIAFISIGCGGKGRGVGHPWWYSNLTFYSLLRYNY